MDNFWEDNATRKIERMKKLAEIESRDYIEYSKLIQGLVQLKKIVDKNETERYEYFSELTPKTDTVIYNELADNFRNN